MQTIKNAKTIEILSISAKFDLLFFDLSGIKSPLDTIIPKKIKPFKSMI